MISSSISLSVRSPPEIIHRSFPSAVTIDGSWKCNGLAFKGSVQGGIGHLKTHALSRPSARDLSLGLIHNGLPFTERPNEASQSYDEDDIILENLFGVKDIWQMINHVKGMLASIDDGDISLSPYDTAWVALVKNMDESGGPQFSSSLDWIASNQFDDGSWGDSEIFTAHDRIINTLSCVIALKTWKIFPDKCEKGLMFLKENMWRLGEEEEEHTPIGFEVAFPSLIDIAKDLALDVPYGDPALQHIYAKRDLKLKRLQNGYTTCEFTQSLRFSPMVQLARALPGHANSFISYQTYEKIPKEMLHEVPTTLLHSLEGLRDLDWNKLLKLQNSNGSFLFSPSSTAFALMHTGDKKCYQYLEKMVDKFNGGVPNVYPVDLFEHIWVVDRLERLGISRYFEAEIKECLAYVHRYWDEKGICWARTTSVHDIDDTAMGFRVLRLHGYDVSADVFGSFESDGEFFCFVGQSNQAVTGMYNLNRASQIQLPGETILERARNFSTKFLREKQAQNQLVDKWIITKDLPGEVEYALDFPFYANLPRIEARWFIMQYGGSKDVWIGKTLYRMPLVNNDLYLELAKADFNQCQAIHQLEWLGLQKWYADCNLREHYISQKSVLKTYFIAMSNIFEPERTGERLGWTKTAVLAEILNSYFNESSFEVDRQKFINDLHNADKRYAGKLVDLVHQLIDHLATRIAQQLQRNHEQIYNDLKQVWNDWISTWSATETDIGMLCVRTIELCKGNPDPMAQTDYAQLALFTSSVCTRLQNRKYLLKGWNNGKEIDGDEEIKKEMQELMKCVLQKSDDSGTRQTFLHVAKSFYYAAHCTTAKLNNHISKVLFERVV